MEAGDLVDSIGEIRALTHLPLIIKVGYDQDFIRLLDRLYFIHDCAHLINSVRFSTVFPNLKSPLTGGGGVSGPAIFEFAQSAIEPLRLSGYEKPIIGGGGVNTVEGARILISAGADAIAIGTAIHSRPYLAHDIQEALQ